MEITKEKQINIAVENLVPKLLDGCKKIFCDNGDYTVHFSFDEEWANYNVKTALFVCGDNTFPSVFEGDECEVPEIDGGTTCYIGVVSGDIVAENVSPKKKTSRWVCVEAVPTISSIAKEPKAPTNDVYVEFMALLNKYIEQGGSGSGGVSPTINITEIDNGYRVTIVDINGEKSFDVTNGKDGVNGVDGKDGYTPQKYVDYWTEADQKEITDYVDTLVNPLIEEINGVEETLRTINEGGIEI
jgi:hypothetical protein